MKLHEIKKDYLEVLRQRYQELYKAVKLLKNDVDVTRGELERMGPEELDVGGYLEDVSDTLDTLIKSTINHCSNYAII